MYLVRIPCFGKKLSLADIHVCNSSGFHHIIFEGYVGKEEKVKEKAITLTPTRF